MSNSRSEHSRRCIRGYKQDRKSFYSGKRTRGAANKYSSSKRRISKEQEHERLFKKIRNTKAFAMLMLLVFVLTIGELTGDPAIPSWSTVISEFSEKLDAYIAEQTQAPATSPSDIIVHVIDVGQGDCTLLQSEKYNILIDAGENGMGEVVCDYLNRIGVGRLDMIVATHPHSDHMGGMDTVIEEIDTDRILMTYIPDEYSIEHSFYHSVIDAIDENGVEVVYANEGDIYTFGNLTLEIMHPTYGEYREDLNDMSISLSIRCGSFGLIACGDLTYEAEEELLGEKHELKADVFIANHHGSALSNSEEFVSAIDPDVVVFSCGENNSYGHPHNSVLKLLGRMNIEYYRTDRSGTVVISCINGIVTIDTEKQ